MSYPAGHCGNMGLHGAHDNYTGKAMTRCPGGCTHGGDCPVPGHPAQLHGVLPPPDTRSLFEQMGGTLTGPDDPEPTGQLPNFRYALMTINTRHGEMIELSDGAQIIDVVSTERLNDGSIDLTVLVALAVPMPGEDMGLEVGQDRGSCPSCGGPDDHNWVESANGMFACQKITKAHRPEEIT